MKPIASKGVKPFLPALAFALLLPGAAQAWGFGAVAEGLGLGVTGSGNVQTQTRAVGTFNAIELRGSTDIEVRVGDATAVSVVAEDNILPLISTEVQNGRLIVKTTGSYRTRHSPKVVISTPSLAALTIDGSGDAKLSNLKGEKLALEISGSGDILAEGAVEQLKLSIDGSSDANLVALQTQRATIEINGSGDVNLSVAAALDAVVNGSGDIVYHGEPAQVSSHVHGSGEIAKR